MMSPFSERLKNPIVSIALGLGIGLALGLIIAWGLWPAKYTGAYPKDLKQAEKIDYLRMSIESYGATGDAMLAKQRLDYLEMSKGDSAKALDEIRKNPGALSPELVERFITVATGGQAPAPVVETPGAVVQTPGAAVKTPKPAGGTKTTGWFSWWYVLICLVVLALAGGLAYWFLFRDKFSRTGEKSAAMQAAEARKQAAWTDYSSAGSEPPVAQFMASYKIGDDLFDDSFSIDSAAGEFLGECGVGISDTIGVGDPKKVSAFEVWLFDKNDIQTVTKVIMSAHAFNDPSIRQRLEAKGEPVLATPGAETVLETQTLQLVARVVDMAHGSGPAPAESHFEHFILELAIWQK